MRPMRPQPRTSGATSISRGGYSVPPYDDADPQGWPAGESRQHHDRQNVSFSAACICLGAVDVAVTRPTVLVSRVAFGAAKLGVFGRLNTSHRNCSLDRSRI